tara:strand:+ start:2190 stop:3104 length:915 start_codon:yes stop_codon:yes gene_type:complete
MGDVPLVAGMGYVAWRSKLCEICGDSSIIQTRSVVANLTRDLFRAVESREITGTECVVLLDLLSAAFSFCNMGKGILSAGKQSRGIFRGEASDVKRFRMACADFVVQIGSQVHGKNLADEGILDVARRFPVRSATMGGDDPEGHEYLKSFLDIVSRGFALSDSLGTPEFRNGPDSLFEPFRLSRLIANTIDGTETPSQERLGAVEECNSHRDSADSRVMSIFLDCMSEVRRQGESGNPNMSNVDASEAAATTSAMNILRSKVGDGLFDSMFQQFQAYGESRLKELTESVRITGVDICDYRDQFY